MARNPRGKSGIDAAAYGDSIDRGLARDVLSATRRARGGGLAPAILGRSARNADSADFKGLPRTLASALKASGHSRESLATLRLSDLGAAASKITLAQVDRLHEEAVRATYRGLKLPGGVAETMVKHRRASWELLDFHSPCGIGPDTKPIPIDPDILGEKHVDIDSILDRLREITSAYRGIRFPLDIDPPRGGPEWRTQFGEGPHIEDYSDAVDLLQTGDIDRVRGVEGRLEQIDELEGRPGSMLALAQGLAGQGDEAGALKVLERVVAMDPKADAQRSAYQLQVVAPAFAAAVGETPEASLAAAKAAISAAPAGTAASTVAYRSAARASGAQARRVRSGARGPGRGRRARKTAAINATVGAASGLYLDGVDAQPAVALESATALLDLHRAYAAALTGESAMPIDGRRSRNRRGRASKSDATEIFDLGPSAYLGDPVLRTHTYEAIFHLHTLCKRKVPCGTWDLFRFDWVSGEARKLLEDLGRIDALAIELIDLLYAAAIDKIQATDAFLKQLDELVQRIVAAINSAAGKLRDTIAAAVPRLRELGALQAIYDVLKAWPHTNWITVITAVSGAFTAGTDPVIAARDAIGASLGAGIAAAVTGATAQITATLGAIEADLKAILQPDPAANPNHPLVLFRQQLTDLLGPNAANPLQPLDDALASVNLVAVAQPILNELGSFNPNDAIPAWLQTVLLLYVAAPFVVALSIVSGAIILKLFGVPLSFAGWVASAVCSFILIAGAQYIVALVLQAFDGLLSRAGEIQAEVNRLITRLRAIGDDLVAALAISAMLKSSLDALNALIAKLDDAFPPEVNAALSDGVLAARTALRSNLATVLQAVEDSFFRETLEIVEVLPELEDAAPAGKYDPSLGYANRLAGALSHFEAERIRRVTEPAQVLTQVISLKQVLAGTALQVTNALQGLLTAGGSLGFELSFDDLDRVAPGLHRQLVRDVQVQVDFDLDAVPLPPIGSASVPLPGQPTGTLSGPAGQEITRADAIAAIVEENTALAGGSSDPALDAAVPGGGFRGLPVSAGRLPTGLPALLTHNGISRFKIKDAQSIEDAIERDSRLAAGLTLEEDPNEELANAGWHRLTICEGPQQQLFSHFRVLEDGVRFFDPEKEINPFEFRSAVGGWTLEIPAVKLGLIEPQLPPIRDVRLIISTIARYDSSLASGIVLPPLPATAVLEPDPREDDDLRDLLVNPLAALQTTLTNVASLLSDLLDTVGQIPALLQGLQTQLTSLIGQVASLGSIAPGGTQAIEDLREDLEEAIATSTQELSTKIAELETSVGEGLDSLGSDLDVLGEKVDEIADISATSAGLLASMAGGGGVPERQLRVLSLSTADLGANASAVLAGSATGTWSVDAAMLAARGITEPATVAWVVVTAVTGSGSLVGGVLPGGNAPAWPAQPATLTFTPASGAAAQTASLTFDSPTATIDGADLGGGTAAASPRGAWALKLPAGMPALTEALVAIFVEVA